MTDIAEFLTARYDEDEQLARACLDGRPSTNAEGEPLQVWPPPALRRYENGRFFDGWPRAQVPFIAAWSPERVLAEVATKRSTLALHMTLEEPGDSPKDGHCWVCQTGASIAWSNVDIDYEPWPCRTVRLLAAPYADHPDYQESWKI